MQNTKNNTLLVGFVLILALMAITRFTPLRPHWGSWESKYTSTITVTGEAKETVNNQIANFTAGVEAIETDKDTALTKVNEAMNELIAQVKAMGIADADIQTQNASVYQETEYEQVEPMIYPPMPDTGSARKGNWRANSSVSITLRNVDQAQALLDLLNNSGANYVYGPNFSLDTETENDELLAKAVIDAREKAEKLATANGQKVGKIISLSEMDYPMYGGYAETMSARPMDSGKAMPVPELEPGSSQVRQSVSVTFELY
jgi:uncharacterized protein YggE